MNKTVQKKRIQKWVDTLVSRKYKKGCGSLKEEEYNAEIDDFVTVDKYCVMGVGACLMPNNKYVLLNNDLYSVGKYYGLDEDEVNSLVEMNDTKGYKFYQMARWLRRKFLEH